MKEKDYSISLLRMLAVISIIFCHSFEYSSSIFVDKGWILESIGNYLANGVQVFLIISSFLYGAKSKKNLFSDSKTRIKFLLKNSLKILKDYWVYCLLVIFPVYYLKESIILTKREVLGILVTSNVIDGVHHLWFIPYILFCYFLTPYLYDIKEYLKSKSKKGFITGVIFVLFIIIIFSYFFKFYFIPEWICCYVIGFFMIDIISLLDYNEKNILKIFILFNFVVLNILRYYCNYINPNLFSREITIKLTQWSQVFFAIVSFFIVYKREILSKKLKKILDFSDKYSYDIYLAHMIYVKGALSVIFLTKFLILNYLVATLLSVVSGIILYHSCRKIEKLISLKKE
ncbi:acyltransferase [Fusobacterium polymorphum]|uniref:acyltransferase family protein n=1 Tax=Fusobacterium nucleatum subsp. polymorphum TaxID=76857 RepID=UPI00300BEFEC